MTMFQRAASIAAAFCVCAMATYNAPGFALTLDRPVLSTPVDAPSPIAGQPLSVPAINVPIVDAVPSVTDGPVVTPTPEKAFLSLAAAVEAQSIPDQVDGELACLAIAVYHEAKSEPLAGQLAVAQVVLNRTASGRFPRSVCSVVTQAGQFSFVRGGRMPALGTGPMHRRAIAVAKVAMADAWKSDASKALFFHARRVSPGWRLTRVATIGNHIFYR